MMQRHARITLAVMFVILIIFGYFAVSSYQEQRDRTSNSSASTVFTDSDTGPSFTDQVGNPANLDQYLGSVIVAHAWASWVPSSPQSLSDLAEIQTDYRDQGVVVLAINRGEPRSTVNSFVEQLSIDSLTVIIDTQDRYFSTVEGITMPETIIYDTDGNIVHHQRGVITSLELREYVNQALTFGE